MALCWFEQKYTVPREAGMYERNIVLRKEYIYPSRQSQRRRNRGVQTPLGVDNLHLGPNSSLNSPITASFSRLNGPDLPIERGDPCKEFTLIHGLEDDRFIAVALLPSSDLLSHRNSEKGCCAAWKDHASGLSTNTPQHDNNGGKHLERARHTPAVTSVATRLGSSPASHWFPRRTPPTSCVAFIM